MPSSRRSALIRPGSSSRDGHAGKILAAAPGRCGSFTGAWFHPRPRRCQWSRLGISQTNFFGRQTKVFGGAWCLPRPRRSCLLVSLNKTPTFHNASVYNQTRLIYNFLFCTLGTRRGFLDPSQAATLPARSWTVGTRRGLEAWRVPGRAFMGVRFVRF